MSSITVPPILTTLVGRIAMAVPARARTAFLELLLGAAATKSGHVTDAILTSGLSRRWTTYFWFLERGRWSWLQVWHALLGELTTLFAPAVWHVVVDDTVVERLSTRAPGSMVHHNHTAKPNRPPFLRGQGWLCLAAVVQRGFHVGAVPLMLRLVRRGARQAQERTLPAAPARAAAGTGAGTAGCLVHARLADPVRPGRRPHRDRPCAARSRPLHGAPFPP